MKLTDTAIRKQKPADKPVKLFDGGGMFLLVMPNGGRWWRLTYRYQQKRKDLSLGTYPAVSLKTAREKRDEARKLLAKGIDPSAIRKAERRTVEVAAAETFEAVAREWFAKFSAAWVKSHSEKIIRRLERDVFPWIGAKHVGKVTAPELLTVPRRIEARGAIATAQARRPASH